MSSSQTTPQAAARATNLADADLPLVETLAAQAADDRTSSLGIVERCLARIGDPSRDGKATFIKVWEDEARTAAAAVDNLRACGYLASPIAGAVVSIKDLLDVKGEVTRAAAKPLDDAPPATEDAPVIRRLKAANAVLIGRTNMTPFAYSVVGLNAHFGTPVNPYDANRIAGGSSSGAAVSVARGMAMAAIGSDTVGSIRVPAALCGVVAFKPTQRRVPRDGSVPLSWSLDTIGPLARSVEDCARAFSVISGGPLRSWARSDPGGLRLAIPNRYLVDGLDDVVAPAFENACSRLSRAGARIGDLHVDALEQIKDETLFRTIQSVEALAWHGDLLDRRGDAYEPRIKARIESGRKVAAPRYALALQLREALIAAFDLALESHDALILPAVPCVAPTFRECEADEDAVRTRLLRNTAPFNVLDACAITIPIHQDGALPVGLMVVARSGQDANLLDIAHVIERALNT